MNLNITLFKPRVSHIDLLLFSRQLHTLLKGRRADPACAVRPAESAINPAMKDVIQDVRESPGRWPRTPVSLARHPRVFSPFYVSMVRVGEATGLLEEIFLRLFEHLEFERFMREQVKSALRYPMFVVIAMAAAIVVINLLVIPAFARVFAGFGSELPLMTRILLGTSNFFVEWWPLMLAAVVGGAFAFRAWVSTVEGRYRWRPSPCASPLPARSCTRRPWPALPAALRSARGAACR